MTQHSSLFEVKMTLTGLTSSYLALLPYYDTLYNLRYYGTLYNLNELIWNERQINLKWKINYYQIASF